MRRLVQHGCFDKFKGLGFGKWNMPIPHPQGSSCMVQPCGTNEQCPHMLITSHQHQTTACNCGAHILHSPCALSGVGHAHHTLNSQAHPCQSRRHLNHSSHGVEGISSGHAVAGRCSLECKLCVERGGGYGDTPNIVPATFARD